jgi:hypothetical protein
MEIDKPKQVNNWANSIGAGSKPLTKKKELDKNDPLAKFYLSDSD